MVESIVVQPAFRFSRLDPRPIPGDRPGLLDVLRRLRSTPRPALAEPLLYGVVRSKQFD
jgi:hypothetical protein